MKSAKLLKSKFKEQLKLLDQKVFLSDALDDPDTMKEFKRYLRRWNDTVKSRENYVKS